MSTTGSPVHGCSDPTCPICNPRPWWETVQTYRVGHIQLPPKGCICPPGSEKTCPRYDCGRKSGGVAYNTSIAPTTALEGEG